MLSFAHCGNLQQSKKSIADQDGSVVCVATSEIQYLYLVFRIIVMEGVALSCCLNVFSQCTFPFALNNHGSQF